MSRTRRPDARPRDDVPSHPIPADVLRAHGWELTGVLAGGASGPRCVVRDRSGERFLVVPVERADAALLERCRRLAGLRNPHLPQCGPPVDLDDDRVGVPVELVDGPDLATLVAGAGQLSPAQAVTVAVPLATALGTLHAAGLVHGDVAPANVVVRPDGRPVLVDLVHGASRGEAGTPGLAAPERAHAATEAGDVYALGRTVAAVLGPGESDAHVVVRGVLGTATEHDPGRRPTARELARACYDALPGAPLPRPDDAVLAASWVRSLADPSLGRTVVRPPRGRGRHRRPRRSPGPRTAVAVVTLAVAGVLLHVTAASTGGTAAETQRATGPGARAETAAATTDPVAAAEELTRRRARALVDADEARLAAVSVPGSPADAADRRLLAEIPSADVGDLDVEVLGSRLVEHAGAVARVAVRSRAVVDPEADSGSASAPARDVVLVLRLVEGEWRVSDVEAVP